VDGEVSYMPTEDQSAQVSRDNFVARLRRGRTWRGVLVLCIVMGLVLAFLDWTDGYEALHVAIMFVFGFAIVAVVQLVAWGICFVSLPRRARRLFREMRMRRGPNRWRWDEDGFELATPNGAATYRWDEVLRGTEGRHAFMLFVSEDLPFFLPREVLEPAQERSFRGAMQAGLAGRG
jgi:hypothetical protein